MIFLFRGLGVTKLLFAISSTLNSSKWGIYAFANAKVGLFMRFQFKFVLSGSECCVLLWKDYRGDHSRGNYDKSEDELRMIVEYLIKRVYSIK